MNRLRLERSLDVLLLEDLDGVDDADTIRVACILDELIEHAERHPRADYDGFTQDEALWLLRDLGRQGPSAGRLRAYLRNYRAELSQQTS